MSHLNNFTPSQSDSENSDTTEFAGKPIISTMNKSTIVPFHAVDREWDMRVNVPTDQDLNNLRQAVEEQVRDSKFRYVLISGVEVGTRPYQDDYLIRHVHLALIYNNRVSKSSILKNLNIKQGHGYYLVPRNRAYPYSGWKKHHTKKETKVDENNLLEYEYGLLPPDREEKTEIVKRSEGEKKRKLDEIIVEMRKDIEAGNEEEAFKKFPRNFLTYGEKIKAMIVQKRDFFKTNGDPHIWLTGHPGDGKSALMQIIYPKYYNKNLDSRFFDLFKPEYHTHTLLQDLDHATVEKLGVQFLKTICDEAGFPVDQKYKTPQLARTTVLVTSNFPLEEVLPEDMKGRNENLIALKRRFWCIYIKDFLRSLDLKLLSKYEIQQLKKEGNKDPRRLFMAYDYLRDTPTGEPIPSAEELQQKVRDLYYK